MQKDVITVFTMKTKQVMQQIIAINNEALNNVVETCPPEKWEKDFRAFVMDLLSNITNAEESIKVCDKVMERMVDVQ